MRSSEMMSADPRSCSAIVWPSSEVRPDIGIIAVPNPVVSLSRLSKPRKENGLERTDFARAARIHNLHHIFRGCRVRDGQRQGRRVARPRRRREAREHVLGSRNLYPSRRDTLERFLESRNRSCSLVGTRARGRLGHATGLGTARAGTASREQDALDGDRREASKKQRLPCLDLAEARS